MIRTARLLSAPVVLSLFILGGCAQSGPAAGGKSVCIGSTKSDLLGLPAEYRALHLRLEKCAGQPVRFVNQPDAPGLEKQLELGNIAYAFMSPAEYAAVDEPSKLTVIAAAVNKAGKTSRFAYLVTRANSPVKAVADCKGKRFAFGTYHDLLTDVAAQRTLESNGLPVKDLLPEMLTPPPLGMEFRLYMRDDAAKTIAFDPTVEAGVIDELTYAALPEKGGNLITGPSKDQFRTLVQTVAVPELLVVAGPSADAALTAKLKTELLDNVKTDERVCKELGITGFAEPDKAACDAARQLLVKTVK
jgi:ABC-type phosphate/phosphonate transport system substrate-binding protein